MNTLITGVSGSGKTTIAAELTKLGHNARNMDSVEGLCAWINLATGQPDPDFQRLSVDDWLDKYDWLWDEKRLKNLLSETPDTFFCGSSGNQDRFYGLFDKVFLLAMNDELIRDRILNNSRDHDYGRRPGEIDAIIGYYEDFQDKAIAAGAVVIDAKKPVNEIVNLILAETVA